LAYLPTTGAVLDVGCGNGRLAHVLDEAGRGVAYLGVDSSSRLLEIARSQAASLHTVKAEFMSADVTLSGWSATLPVAEYDGIAALAVLHHVPGWQTRCDLLKDLCQLLTAGGNLVVSAWQFTEEARLRRKVVPWPAVGLSDEQVEGGDVLLDWQRSGSGVRYCHLIDEAELAALAHAAGLAVINTFYADGRSHRLNLFAVLRLAADSASKVTSTLDRVWMSL
jgi:2-polyprenyl-3-methyl-5-hydroxy-6-metoxy-1,4-benzoquinol methylase